MRFLFTGTIGLYRITNVNDVAAGDRDVAAFSLTHSGLYLMAYSDFP